MDGITAKSNKNFTSRCAQVRDAKWVCQKVHSYSHISPSRINRTLESMSEPYIDTFQNPYAPLPPKAYGLFNLLGWRDNLVEKINTARRALRFSYLDDYKRTNKVISQLKDTKLGNCGEDAYLSGAILKMNGVKDACTTKLTIKGHIIDHGVCVFNRDGSAFNGKANKNTIIIDPWVGDADFASNMFVKYKGIYNQQVDKAIQPDSKIEFWDTKHIDLTDKEKTALLQEHPELKFNNSKREFMQK